MSIFYKSERVGKNGKTFSMHKFRTMKEGSDKVTQFANSQVYIKYGRFLRKYKIDELPQIWNIIKRDMNIVGPRPEEQRVINILPQEHKNKILSIRPGLTSLASLHFIDEEKLLQTTNNITEDFWMKVKPMKILLDIWYVDHRCLLLNLAIIWLTIKKICFSKN